MGGLISRVQNYFTKAPMRLVMLGLGAAGKTTILYKLNLGSEIITTIPTIGFNVETVEHKKLELMVWDVGGRSNMRALWRHYFQNTTGIIFVVDSNDRDCIDDEQYSAKEELSRILSEDQLRDAPLLVFANKQDLPNAMSVAEITQRLGLHSLRHREWYVQGSSASTDADALYEGLDWMQQVHTGKNKEQKSDLNRYKEFQKPTPPVPEVKQEKKNKSPPAKQWPIVDASTLIASNITKEESSVQESSVRSTSVSRLSSSSEAEQSLVVAAVADETQPGSSFEETTRNYEISFSTVNDVPPPSFNITHTPLVQLEAVKEETDAAADPSFVLVESNPMDTTQQKKIEAEWIDAHEALVPSSGHEFTHTAQTVALRMVEAR